MSATRFVGFLIAAIGYLSGLALVAHPFMAWLDTSALVMAILFPTCLLSGLPLYAAGSGRAQALGLFGMALIGMGLFALIGLFADGTGIVSALRPPLALWAVAPAALSGGLLLNYFAGALQRLGAADR